MAPRNRACDGAVPGPRLSCGKHAHPLRIRRRRWGPANRERRATPKKKHGACDWRPRPAHPGRRHIPLSGCETGRECRRRSTRSPLGHRYALLAATAAVVVAGATMPELQNPSFYVVLVVALVACFLAGKFGRVLLPKAPPDYSRTFPPLPGWPSWPPYPKAQPRKPKAGPTREPLQPRKERPAEAPPTMPMRPVPTPVAVIAAASRMPSPSEQEAASALPEALQRLMQPKAQPSGGPTAQEQAG